MDRPSLVMQLVPNNLCLPPFLPPQQYLALEPKLDIATVRAETGFDLADRLIRVIELSKMNQAVDFGRKSLKRRVASRTCRLRVNKRRFPGANCCIKGGSPMQRKSLVKIVPFQFHQSLSRLLNKRAVDADSGY